MILIGAARGHEQKAAKNGIISMEDMRKQDVTPWLTLNGG